jgi:molybdopterin-guanine dinucleotide biosynthesis protein A
MKKPSPEAGGFAAVVLAGERSPGADPLARAAGVPSKILVPVQGRAVVLRVQAAIEAAASIETRWLAGAANVAIDSEPALRESIESTRWRVLAAQPSPASTTLAALRTLDEAAALVTTADHAWLSAAIVDHFLAAARATGADLAIAFARLDDVRARFPDTRRTGWKFADGGYCGCNLFAFVTPRGHAVAALWQRFEQDRKRPWRIVAGLGAGLLLRYATGRLTLADGLGELGRRAGCRVAPVVLPFPEAAVDVDSVADWELVNRVGPDGRAASSRV